MNGKRLLSVLFLLIPALVWSREYHVVPCNAGVIASNLSPGDTMTFSRGVYRMGFSINVPGVLLRSEDGGAVITGLDRIWESGRAARINGRRALCFRSVDRVWDVFVNGKQMQLARFPDKSAPATSMKDWMFTRSPGGSDIVITEKINGRVPRFRDGYYVGNHTPDEKYDKAGFTYWTTFTVPIVSSAGAVIKVDTCRAASPFTSASPGNGNGIGFIIGAKAAMDAPGEWWWGEGSLYLIPPADTDMSNAVVEVRTRKYCLVSSADSVRIEGLDFLVASLRLNGNGSRVENCSVSWITPFDYNPAFSGPLYKQTLEGQWGLPETCTAGVVIEGDGCSVLNSYFGHSWTSGLTISGSHTLVENCLVEDVNWAGRRHAGIHSFGNGNIIRRCTVRNTGSSALEGGNASWVKRYATDNLWEYNRVEDVARLCVDQGFMYFNMQRGTSGLANNEIRYNICRGSRGPDKGKWASLSSGIYLDNNSSGFDVHHNIVIDAEEAFRYNDRLDHPYQGHDVRFYNNTVYNCTQNFVHGIKGGTEPDAEIEVSNNLGIGSDSYFCRVFPSGVVTPGENNLSGAAHESVKDAAGMDFTPVEASDNHKCSYIGAVDPAAGMFKAGCDIVEPDLNVYLTLIIEETP